ncbi:hypothetical protein KTE46_10000 [Burkholderia multivorans]|uniref:hypothetical protein n=1 Tax=Burkholderia multivorans TaxID=87883 RepID=UPI001C23B76A|nr:hypothetical protein [Burkholderia multivorans]MBU9406002.1 hypothetical protein [Burkholderia multivorans]MBU9502936.1 hypothetical protein [Burkholderia multivorans]MCA8461310.1 hypothetical protein [Burkholderia multivorans]
MPNNKVLTDEQRSTLESLARTSTPYEQEVLRSILAAHPGHPGIACAGGHGIAGLGRMTNEDDGFVRLQFVSESAADAFMEAYGPTVDVGQMPEPRAEVTDSARLDWIAHHGISLRQDPDTKRWFLVAPYHTKIECVDDHTRFESARAAIDAARAGEAS